MSRTQGDGAVEARGSQPSGGDHLSGPNGARSIGYSEVRPPQSKGQQFAQNQTPGRANDATPGRADDTTAAAGRISSQQRMYQNYPRDDARETNAATNKGHELGSDLKTSPEFQQDGILNRADKANIFKAMDERSDEGQMRAMQDQINAENSKGKYGLALSRDFDAKGNGTERIDVLNMDNGKIETEYRKPAPNQ